MKGYKDLNTKLNISDVTSKISFMKVNFSKRIINKYTIFRKSTNLPALIFLKLFGTRVMNKIININRIESINNYFRPHFNLYFKVINDVFPIYYSIIEKRASHLPPTLALPHKGGLSKGVIARGRSPRNNRIGSEQSPQTPYFSASNSPIPPFQKGGKGGLQFPSSFTSRRLMNIQPGIILNTKKINNPASNVKINLSLFPGVSTNLNLREFNDSTMHVIHRLTPKAFGVTATSNYNAPYVIQDKRTLPEKQISTQTTQTTKMVIARSKTPREVYPERNDEILRYAQNDKRRAWNDRLVIFSRQNQSVFLRRIIDKYLHTTSVGISPGMILNTQKINNPALKIGANTFSVTDYPEAGNNSKNVNYHRQEKISALFNNIPRYLLPKRSNSLIYKSEIDFLPLAMTKRNVAMIEKHIVNKSTDLILRKPITQNTNTVSESKDHQHKENVILPKTAKDLTKDLKEKSVHEINMIADKVYKILEKRIAIEKDRRGWY